MSTAQAERDEMIAKTDDLFAASVGEHTTEKERKKLMPFALIQPEWGSTLATREAKQGNKFTRPPRPIA